MSHSITLTLLILFSVLLIAGFAKNQHPVGLILLWAGTLGMLSIIILVITRALSVCTPLLAFLHLC
ncbi:hypothetical protein IQ22_01443 [Pseudomonas duriflava]|uniref:Uncharacterized protein n=1 Tax=Pseudomonas duriflava TaxID=459528 RepID=A0A562QFM6_9PSED|nr:hypothetical protein [Pseudomonas duriflava]TWI55519.1 hypothetical protein IQ22_01443 [Pseudomonas duriflava]